MPICTFYGRRIGNLRKLIEEGSNECENEVVSGRNHRAGLCKHHVVNELWRVRHLVLASHQLLYITDEGKLGTLLK